MSERPKKLRRANNRLIEREMMIQNIGDTLIAKMEADGIDKAELARRLKKTSGDVSQLLSGDRNLTAGSISEIAYALGYRGKLVLEPLPGSRQSLKPLDLEVKVKSA